MSEETTVSCPVCGAANQAKAAQCAACGFALTSPSAGEKVDAILEDLLDLSKAPFPESGPPSAAREPEMDEAEAEQLLDSLLVEVEASPPAVASGEPGGSAVAGVSQRRGGAEDVERIPVLATPAETEGRRIVRISGRMFDAVTYGSVASLFAVFVYFRMDRDPFDFSNLFPWLFFAAVAAGGMAAALALFHISNSEVAQGDRLVKQGRYQEALTHYERAIRIVRRPSYAWTSRGVAMKYLGRLDEALRCHENSIRLDSENEVAWCNLGTVYFRKGELGKALECYDKAIGIRPRYAIAWNNKGVVLARMSRFEEADRCHARATKIRPEYVAAWLNRGEVLARLGAQEEARRCLERARAISRSASA